MIIGNVRLAFLVALAAAVAVAAPAAGAGRAPPPRYHALGVDEAEWSLRPSHLAVARGRVRIHVYNRGHDAHDLVIVGPNGVRVAKVYLRVGADVVLRPLLRKAGRYRLYCSLFAGTPNAHARKGMVASVVVR